VNISAALRCDSGLPRRPGAGVLFARHRGLITAVVVFILLFVLVNSISAGHLTYFDISFMAAGAATLAIAAMGETIVILSGGFDLSAGAVISLVNVVLASSMDPASTHESIILWTLAGIGVGMAAGVFNGLFVAFIGLQPIVVTLSTMFIAQGVTLLVMEKPGGFVASQLGTFYLGDAIPGLLPMPIVLLLGVLLLWLWLKSTRFGAALYAIGSDTEAARCAGVRVDSTRFITYVIAGGCYGLAGVFISAQTGSGDPLIGNPLLLSIFTAVVLGGTRLGGGRGGPAGSVFGAYILMSVVNVLLVLNVSAYYSTIAEGVILILAVLAASLSGDSELARQSRLIAARFSAWRAGMLPRQIGGADRQLRGHLPNTGKVRPGGSPPFWIRHAEALRHALPSYLCFAAVVIVTELWLGNAVLHWSYWNSLIVLSSFLAILALGQGTVILTGGLDLCVPWMIGLSGILLAGMVQGSDKAMIYALPAVFVIAAIVGFVNGVGIVALGISPIVMTLATNGVLQGAALLYSGGTPAGFSSPLLRWFMTAKIAGITPVVFFIAVFVVGAVILLSRTPFGRRVYGIGNGVRAARLSGVAVGQTLIGVYVLSALCSCLVGILLTGFSGQASLGMGDDYLLPSIAVVVVGGTIITGGRGQYLGMLGGVLLLTALQTMLAGSNLPYATRAILYGLVVLGAVIALRERRSS
jgi:ribose transport system permease protein